jgi:hypothetical protein
MGSRKETIKIIIIIIINNNIIFNKSTTQYIIIEMSGIGFPKFCRHVELH